MGLWDRLSRRLDELSEELLPDELRDTVEGARELLARGEPNAAIAALDRVLAEKPNHATALYLLGAAQLRRGDTAAAGAAFEQAIAVRAGYTEAMVGLAEAKLLGGDAAAAVPILRDVLGRGGGRELLAQAYRVLGRAYLATGEPEKGLRELRKALAEDPADSDAAVALAETLLDDAKLDAEEARGPLARIVSGPNPEAPALAAFGRLEVRAGHLDSADKMLRRALDGVLDERARVAALLALAGVLEKRRDTAGAHEQLLRALAIAPKEPALHERIAELHLAVGNVDAALDALDHAAAVSGKPPWTAFEVALAADRPERAAAAARLLLATGSDDPRVRGVVLAADGDAAGARAALAMAPPGRGVSLALARLELATGDADAAAARALGILRADPSDGAARRLHDEAARSALGLATPPSDLYALATRVHALMLARLPALAPDAARIVESYDRPLLVTVMGEFSSGKSSFVNAFLGAEVAPIGITPTTATINILKYGRTRAARVVYQNDDTRELTWEEAARVLRNVSDEEAGRIRHVEVLYPLEALERVNIVDTPGLNSILPEHEATARAFIGQADAIVWLFAAGQAGKATEREALEKIHGEGKRVLGVVNKIDQVGEQAEVVVEHLRAELGGLVEALIPVSARRALAARKAGDEAALAASAWPALEAALEERFFAQARALKRDACAKRLGALLVRARGEVGSVASVAGERETTLSQAASAARADAALFARSVVPEERRALSERVAGTYRAAARDVLELVRPRKTPFGSNVAAAADRDYLIGFLERGLIEAIRPTRERVARELEAGAHIAGAAARQAADVIGARAGEEIEAHGADAAALVEARVFDRSLAYLRGVLHGGSIDAFFTRALPKLELGEDSVYHALVRDAPDLEPELLVPLAAHGEATLRQVGERLDALAARAGAARIDADALAGVLASYDELAARLAEVA